MIRIALILLFLIINGCDSNSSPTGVDSSPAISFDNYPDITTIQLTDEVGNELGISGDGISSACSTYDTYPDRSNDDTSSNDISLPEENRLSNIYPNPFNPSFSVEVILYSEADLRLFIVNAQDEVICELVNDIYATGNHILSSNMSTCSENISYGYYRLIADFGGKECFENLHYLE